ncbi:MAG: prepilin peptidase, partial [Syntrophomonadaceae bacterium]|nr:prepilin peptidase [Syntrophomonadaceae bacterium]
MTFILGLFIGSFLNVLIYRIPRGESVVWPGSHCGQCGHALKPIDLVPVLSYLFLRGKCRYCGAHISFRYPFVELLTAFAFLLVYYQYGYTVWTAAGCVLAALLIVVAFTDIDEGIIPDVITYPGMLIGLAFSFFTIGIKSALIAMLGFGLIFFLIAILSRGGMGGGDVKLVAVIGAFVGPINSVLVFIISSLAGGLWALGLLLFKGAGRKTEVRFGPFLALAGFIAFLYGS